jgi:hypothetical protein
MNFLNDLENDFSEQIEPMLIDDLESPPKK